MHTTDMIVPYSRGRGCFGAFGQALKGERDTGNFIFGTATNVTRESPK